MELVIREAQSLISCQSHRTGGNACFHCGKKGHWVRDCPYRSPDGKSPSVDSSDFPIIRCRCGAGACVIRTSFTARNPGRKFYSCPAKMSEKCNFFKWCDDYEISKSPQFTQSPQITQFPQSPQFTQFPQSPQPPQFPIPTCSCGAGLCSVSMEKIGPNAGRRYFICPVKKGQGACNFFQWEDDQVNAEVHDRNETKQCSSEQSTGISQQDIEPGKSCSLKEGASSFQHLERVDDSLTREDSCPSNPAFVLGPSEEYNMSLIGNGGRDETSKFHSLKFHNGADVISLEDLVHQILRCHVFGWLGRLAFPPPRCLTVPLPKPFLCCVFPCYDPIFVPQQVKPDAEYLSNPSQSPSDPPRLTPDQNAEILDLLLEPSGPKNPPISLGGNAVISKPILEAFQQAALHIKNELITLLESIDPLDHDSMVLEANSAFAGLDHLGIDYRPFYERVKKFISCSSALSRIESTIRTAPSSQQLMDSYHHKMSRHESMARVHSKAMTALTSSGDRLRSLQEEAIRVKQMLLQIETELSCSEVETAVMEILLVQISQDMSESKQNLEAVHREASRAVQLQQQREEERSIAKEAMEGARVQLRQ